MLELLLLIVVVWIVIAIILWGVQHLPLDATVQQIIKVIAIVGGLLWTIYQLYTHFR